MGNNYIVFSRAARNWAEFSSANKRVVRKGMTLEEARAFCSDFNDKRTEGQKRRGVKYEFCAAGDL